MNVLHLSIEDSLGAGRAAVRINNALTNNGIDSNLAVIQKSNMTNSLKIELKTHDRVMLKLMQKANLRMVNRYGEHGLFHSEKFGIDFTKLDIVKNADILHFHWINGGIWSDVFAKGLLNLNKPVVWTLHDMWPFTGGCHYDAFCGRYKKQCGCCPILNSSNESDLSSQEQKFKKKIYDKLNIRFVGCSQWITDSASSSIVCRDHKHPCVCIPNPIDNSVFNIKDKGICRELLGITTSKKLILFGAISSVSDERKGYKYLHEAIKGLDPEQYMLGVFGANSLSKDFNEFETECFGFINDDLHLSLLYNAADVFVAPSIQENLANTVMESMACGTPVVAFDIGGMKDMITHLSSGYLVQPYNVKELRNGIEQVCANRLNRNAISNSVMIKFSEEKVAKQYMDVYMNMI